MNFWFALSWTVHSDGTRLHRAWLLQQSSIRECAGRRPQKARHPRLMSLLGSSTTLVVLELLTAAVSS
jgi:hypothetical protein